MTPHSFRRAAPLLTAAAIALAASQPPAADPAAAGARLQVALASASQAFADA